MLGVFKWLLRFAAGMALGLAVLACIALLTENAKFNDASRGIFQGGNVIPCMRTQVKKMGEFISRTRDVSHTEVAKNE
jgi:hypothetical protein